MAFLVASDTLLNCVAIIACLLHLCAWQLDAWSKTEPSETSEAQALELDSIRDFLAAAWPRLVSWYQYFNTSQVSDSHCVYQQPLWALRLRTEKQ